MQEQRQVWAKVDRSKIDDWRGVEAAESFCLFRVASIEHAVSRKRGEQHGLRNSLDQDDPLSKKKIGPSYVQILVDFPTVVVVCEFHLLQRKCDCATSIISRS